MILLRALQHICAAISKWHANRAAMGIVTAQLVQDFAIVPEQDPNPLQQL
jgi:hypothetical protein